MKTYMYIAPHIVGNAEHYGMCYDTDYEEKATRKQAEKHGFKTLEYDDFWVAEIENKKVVALYSGEDKRNDQKEVDEVNEGLAFN